jgi:hypothetical protein
MSDPADSVHAKLTAQLFNSQVAAQAFHDLRMTPVVATTATGVGTTASNTPEAARIPMIVHSPLLTAQVSNIFTFGPSLPVESTAAGAAVFADRFDSTVRWWLPSYSLDDNTFTFAATTEGVDNTTGLPLDKATATFRLIAAEPDQLAAERAANPAARFERISPTVINVSLTVTGSDHASGSDTAVTTTAAIDVDDTGAVTATVTLVGPPVVVAYQNLARGSAASLQISLDYRVWRHTWRTEPQVSGLAPTASTTSAGSHAMLGHVIETPDGPITVGPRLVGRFVDPVPIWVTAVDQSNAAIPIGTTFGADAFRTRFTLTSNGITRAIINANDLTGFAQAGTQYRELTSLGDVPSRYPSISRLYIGQVSGDVIAIPQSYGILRGSTGVKAVLEAAVDDSPDSASGCRFEFTFQLAPLVTAVDVARLGHDLLNVPEAAVGPLRLRLPDGLDARFDSVFSGFSASSSAVVDGPDPHVLLARITVVDQGQTPAMVNVNLFLHQLAGAVAPLAGTVAVRVDDLYPTPIETAFVLDLSRTAGSDDISISLPADPTSVTVLNACALDLKLGDAAVVSSAGVDVIPLNNEVLPARAATNVTGVTANSAVLVDAQLALAQPLQRGAVFNYLTLDTQTVQSVQHVLNYDAAFDFAAASITQIDVAAAFTNYPQIVVSSLTLTATHPVDFVHVIVPIDVILTSLAATVTITITPTSGPKRSATVDHDFLDDPVLTITTATVRGA